jgi:hypothetical protein
MIHSKKTSSAILSTLTVLAASVAASTFPSVSHAAPGSVAVVFTPSLTNARAESEDVLEQGLDSKRKFGLGGGLLFDAPLSGNVSLGIGALYVGRKFQVGTGSLRLERTVPTVFVPVEAKLWLGNVFSIGAGAFGAVKVGDAEDRVVVGSGSLSSNSAQDRKSLDYGLTASANFLLPIAERTGFVLGARYLHGLSNNSKNSAYDEKIDDFMLTAGVSFGM